MIDRRRLIQQAMGLSALACAKNTFAQTLSSSEQKSITSIDDIREKTIQTIAFGSCNKQYAEQTHWRTIASHQADLFLWLGDNIYADNYSIAQRQAAYQSIKNNNHYKDLQSKTACLGIWDDHDYASNNRGADYEDKKQSKKLFTEFFDVSPESPIQSREGIYQSITLGPLGKRIQFILLDMRYFKGQDSSQFNLLGEVQWAWLEQELRESTADLLIVASSIHVCSPTTGLGLEGWKDYMPERVRLYDLLSDFDAPLIFLSGDRHMGEFCSFELPSGKRAYEIMSSGLTHCTGFALPNKHRIGNVVGRKNYGLIHIDWSGIRPSFLFELRSAERRETFAHLVPDFSK